jgi:WhiB family transcriptional regulator, redox-sensing transcriptional regulator
VTDIRWLPGPIIDKWEWQLQGACRDEDTALFFHPEGERGPRREAREAAAKAICARCPVLRECARHALASREPYGVWGGMSEAEREAVIGARSSFRPGERSVVYAAADTAVGTDSGDYPDADLFPDTAYGQDSAYDAPARSGAA